MGEVVRFADYEPQRAFLVRDRVGERAHSATVILLPVRHRDQYAPAFEFVPRSLLHPDLP